MVQTINFYSNQEIHLSQLPPLSLYIHIPWCIAECPYCDFNSHALKNGYLPENEYIQALLTDLEYELPDVWGRSIHSIFIGGGTPGLFQAQSINQLLSGIRARIPIQPDAEITLETNPGILDVAKYQGYYDAGINRLSIGVQSFDDAQLKRLGRIHNAKEAHLAIDTALNIFERVNIDMMYALPAQNIQAAIQDIETAIQAGTTHLSAYQLTLEANTAFGQKPPQNMPDDEDLFAIEQAVHDRLFDTGFERYEISAFCKQKHYAQHNVNYWQFGDYIGIGAGAHGKISQHNRIVRTVKARHPKDYFAFTQQNISQYNTRHTINKQELPFEFMLNALRLVQGVPSHYFTDRTSLSLSHIQTQLHNAASKGLINLSQQKIRATAQGFLFLNDILELFLKD